MTTEERVKKLVSEHWGVSLDRVTNTARFEEDLSADSLDQIELCMAIEEDFNVSFTDDEIMKCKNVNDVVVLIETKKEEANVPA